MPNLAAFLTDKIQLVGAAGVSAKISYDLFGPEVVRSIPTWSIREVEEMNIAMDASVGETPVRVRLPAIGSAAGGALGAIIGEWFVSTLIQDLANDPPLPFFVQSRVPQQTAINHAAILVQTTTQQDTSQITGSFVTQHATFDNTTQSNWVVNGRNGFNFNRLSVQSATLYGESGSIIANGNIEARSDTGGTYGEATAIISGDKPYISVTSSRSYSYYARSLPLLGVSGNSEEYNAELVGGRPYSIALRNAIVTVGATDTYTGSLTINTSNSVYIQGNGSLGVSNFADSATIRANNADVRISGATSFNSGMSFNLSENMALVNYTGPITISAVTSDTDQIDLNGQANFFRLSTTPVETTASTNSPVTFQALIDGNVTDVYTLTVDAPKHWDIQLTGTGTVTAMPPLGAVPGDYQLLLAAQSAQHPDVVVSTVHTVRITPSQGMMMQVDPDPLISVPWGPDSQGASLNLNGNPVSIPNPFVKGQIPNAAYTITFTNTSTMLHTFSVDVTGLPQGWLILSDAEGQTQTTRTLPAGGVGQIGLYISPTGEALPPAGAQYPFTIKVSSIDTPSLAQSQSQTFTMPALSFLRIGISPPLVYSSPGSSITFDVRLHNAGNADGSFPLIVNYPVNTWKMQIPSPLSINAGQILTQQVTLHTPDGTIGHDYGVTISAQSGAYRPRSMILVRMVSQQSLAAHQAAQTAVGLHDTPLAAVLDNLGLAVTRLEEDPSSLTRRDTVVTAIQNVVDHLAPYPSLTATDALRDLAPAMRTHTSASDLTADLAALRVALVTLGPMALCRSSRRAPRQA